MRFHVKLQERGLAGETPDHFTALRRATVRVSEIVLSEADSFDRRCNQDGLQVAVHWHKSFENKKSVYDMLRIDLIP